MNKLEGDYDVFGDGSATIISTPGHQSLLVKLPTSMTRMADILAKEDGEIWINHDRRQRESLKLAPAFYE